MLDRHRGHNPAPAGWAARLIGLLLPAALLLGCAAPAAPAPMYVAAVSTMAIVVATPTLPSGEGVLTYLPMVAQRSDAPATPQATRAPGAPPPATPSQAVDVSYARTSQRSTASGLLLEIEGEVRNGGPRRVQDVRVVMVARGAGGAQCGRGAVTLLGQGNAIVYAGDSWPFAGVLHLECPADEVAFQVVAVETDTTPLRLAIEGGSVGVSAAGDWVLSGSLRNGASVPVAYPRALVTLRAADGTYVAAGLAYAGVSSLSPGGTVPFEVVIPASKATGWASFTAIGVGERG